MVSKNKVTLELCKDYFKGIYLVVEIIGEDNKYTYNPIKIINNRKEDGCSIVSYLTDKQKPKKSKYLSMSALMLYHDKVTTYLNKTTNEENL